VNLKSGTSSVKLPKPLRIFWFLNIALTGLCVVIMRGEKYILHRKFPYTTPFIFFQHWVDLLCFIPRFRHIHHLDFFSEASSCSFRFMYPAPVALLYESFYVTGWHPVRLFFS
jgi:hypothetical protein